MPRPAKAEAPAEVITETVAEAPAEVSVEPVSETEALYAKAVAEEDGYTLVPLATALENHTVEPTEVVVDHAYTPGAVAIKMVVCKRK